MPTFDTYTCTECGEQFTALSGARAAEEEYCSPSCVEQGKELV